jgi:hypothetical protein
MIEIICHRIDDRVGHLGATGAIEVGDGVPTVSALQSGKVAADLGDGKDLL